MNIYDAVIFDMDGLLLDTEALIIQAGKTAFTSVGVEAPVDFFHWCVGVDTATCRAKARELFGQDLDIDHVERVMDDEWERLTSTHIPFKLGAERVLDYLAGMSIPRAIATSSSLESAKRKMRVARLERWVETVVSVDCVSNAKPAPDPYLHAAKLLGFEPNRCLAFEDSDTGARAALAAGMTVVQVPDINPAGKVPVHFVAKTLEEGARISGLMTA